MITWQDFILDDVVGPVLAMPENWNEVLNVTYRPGNHRPVKVGRTEERSSRPDARIGASGNAKPVLQSTDIQETRQEQRPARMAGPSSHDSTPSADAEACSATRKVDRMSAGSDSNSSEMQPVRGEG